MVENCEFSASSQNSVTEKSFFGHFEVISPNVYSFPRAGVVVSCFSTEKEVLQREDEFSSWYQKKLFIFLQKY